jgi:ssDNA-binding Zn-finger/Zn-ribbon topoisomerase 1
MEAYCVKCKETKEMKNPEETVTSNGRKMAKGVCPDCGTKMNKFLKA